MTPNDNIDLKTINTTDEFLGIARSWDELCLRSGSTHIFQSFSYIFNVWNSIACKKGTLLNIIIGRVNNEIVIIWPLMIDDNKLRFISSDTLEYRDFIVEKKDNYITWIHESWDFIINIPCVDVFLFQNLKLPSNVVDYLPRLHNIVPVGGGVCPIIKLEKYKTFDEYLSHLPSSLLKNQRYQWRRVIKKSPKISFTVINNEEEILSTLSWIMKHKLIWLNKVGKKAESFRSLEMLEFFEKQLSATNKKGNLVVAKLSDGKNIISAGFGYQFDNHFLFHVFTYDMKWNQLSPSRLFLECLVGWCYENEVKTFDFMPGEEAYKYVWATDSITTNSYLGSLSLKGLLLIKWNSVYNHYFKSSAIVGTICDLIPKNIKSFIKKHFIKPNELGIDLSQFKE